jgi:hypothetical protein
MTSYDDSSSQTIPLQEEDSDDMSIQTGVTTVLASNVMRTYTVRLSMVVASVILFDKINTLTYLFMPLPVAYISPAG